MSITMRELWTIVHGMGFGALFLLACSGALIEIYRVTSPGSFADPIAGRRRFVVNYLLAMAALAWTAVLTGAYVIYPWYRAAPPPAMGDLSGYPQHLLQSSPATAGWHSIGMEWKEYVAWFAPIAITMVAAVFIRYGADLKNHRQLRTTVLSFTAAAFLCAAIAGFFGAMLVKAAPVQGGRTVQLMDEQAR